jgi:hypothetical protein
MVVWLTKPRKIYRELVDKALFRSVFMPGHDKYPNSKPGALIEKLSPEDREQLKNLKSAEIKNDWLPLW